MKKLFGLLLGLVSLTAMAQGQFDVLSFNDFKVHVYQTNDTMRDASIIVEGNDGLITLEPPLFRNADAEFNAYIDKLGKPVVRTIFDYHIGGTKNGLMFGEAVVITNRDLQKDFRWQIKNKGAMLAKGFACSIGFDSLFKDGLYFELAKNSNEQADYLKRELVRLGYDVAPSYTNQLFVTMDKERAKDLVSRYGCEEWCEVGDKMTIRFVTSFSTKKEDVKELVEYLEK